MKQIPNPDPAVQGGSALCVQDIKSPRSDVWGQILDFDSYVGKVPKLKECKVYKRSEDDDGNKSIDVTMKVRASSPHRLNWTGQRGERGGDRGRCCPPPPTSPPPCEVFFYSNLSLSASPRTQNPRNKY